MNERIRKLISQAGGIGYDDDGNELTPALVGSELEKFAELIVKECATVILNNDIEKQEDYGVNHLFFNGWERGVIDSCHAIKEHFGVEE